MCIRSCLRLYPVLLVEMKSGLAEDLVLERRGRMREEREERQREEDL